MKKQIKVVGMTCNSCAEKISKNLFSLPEIEDIIVNIEENIIDVELNDHLSDDVIKTVIKSSGKYEVIGIE